MKKIILLVAFMITSIAYSQNDLIEDFEAFGAPASLTYFGNGAGSAQVVNNPSVSAPNMSAKVLQITSTNANNVWQGSEIKFGSDVLDLNSNNDGSDITVTMDVYSATAMGFLVKAEDKLAPTGSTQTGQEYNLTTTGTWQTITLTMSGGLDGTVTAQGLFDQLTIFLNWDTTANGFNGPANRVLYIDNIKSTKTVVSVLDDATLSDLQVDGITITGFAPAQETYTVGVSSGSTPQITSAPTAQSAPAAAVITQAATIPGDATVVVTAQDGTTTKTYTVSFFINAPATPAPTPTYAPADVISIYSDAYTDIPLVAFQAAWSGTGVTDDITIATDNAKRFNNFDFMGIEVNYVTGHDFSAMDMFHIDYWVPAGQTNALSVKLVDTVNPPNQEDIADFGTTVAGSWQSIDIPVSSFTDGPLTDLENISQILLDSDGVSAMVIVDNIFFYKLPTATFTGAVDTDWATSGNWDTNSVPDNSTNVVIPAASNVTVSATTGASMNNITIDATATVTIASGGSILPVSSATGNITYQVNVADTNWHLISSPVGGEQYGATWNTANSIASGTVNTDNRGVSLYNNDDIDGTWVYFVDGNADTDFLEGAGYALKRTSAGNYNFTGTLRTAATSRGLTVGNINLPAENRWNLVGNTFPSYMNIADYLTNNAAQINDLREAVYLYNDATQTYTPHTTGYIHPGQAFFISRGDAGAATIATSLLSHQTGVTFYKNSTPKITLNLSNGSTLKTTEINYLADKTKGLDPRFDLGTFTGQATDFDIYTYLLSGYEDVSFMKQALPNDDLENMIIPVGIKAKAGKEVTFTADASNLPSGIFVYIEDRVNNTFVRLDESDSKYTVTLNENIDGKGRFYLHTKSSSVLSTDDTNVDNISMFTTNTNTLRIVGAQGKQNVKLFTILGKQVLNSSFTSNGVSNVSLPNLSTGVYIVQLSNDKGSMTKKIILE